MCVCVWGGGVHASVCVGVGWRLERSESMCNSYYKCVRKHVTPDSIQ